MIIRVEAIIFDTDGKILIGRNANNGYYMFPGGKMEVGEKAITTAKREVKEEVDVGLINPEVIGEKPFINEKDQTSTIFVMGKCRGHYEVKASDKMEDIVFLFPEEIEKLFRKENINFEYLPLIKARIEHLWIAYNKYTNNRIYKESQAKFRSRVEIVVKNKDGKILIGQNPRNGIFVYPGGGIKDGEDIFTAAKRETAEEAGISIRPLKVLTPEPLTYLYDTPKSDGTIGSKTTFVLAEPIEKKVKKEVFGADNDILQDMKFLTPEEAKQKLSPELQRHDFLEDIEPNNIVLKKQSNLITEPLDIIIEDDDIDDVDECDLKDYLFYESMIEKKADDEFTYKKTGNSTIATVGQFIFNDILPENLRNYKRIVTKKEIANILQKVADTNPDKYVPISDQMYKIGNAASVFNLRHLSYEDFEAPVDIQPYLEKGKKEYERILKENGGNVDYALADAYSTLKTNLTKDVIAAGLKNKNNLAVMAVSGARGSEKQITDLIAAPLLVSDYKNKPIPIILSSSYSDGLSPAEYHAASNGTRRGVISTKLAVPLAGYMGKMLSWSMSNMVVTDTDCKTKNGNKCSIDDKWNIGKFLAIQTENYPANTLLTESVISDLKNQHITEIIVRSPLTCESKEGICSKCLGKTEIGFAGLGYNAGTNTAAALSEPLSQGMLSEKHTGGAIKNRVGGFPLIKRFLEIPSVFEDKAKLTEIHGKVKSIDKVGWGGWNITINDKKYYTPEQNQPIVKVGDTVEKGDAISAGVLNPLEVTNLKGFGFGRKALAEQLRKTFEEMDGGSKIDRAHYEVTARALVNFADVIKPISDYLPGETARLDYIKNDISFNDVSEVPVKNINPFDIYLAKQVMNYSVGTEITPKVKDDLIASGYTTVYVTKEKLPIIPTMIRIQDTPKYDKDFMNRLISQGLKKHLTDSVARGDFSSTEGINFVHPYAHGLTFGKKTFY